MLTTQQVVRNYIQHYIRQPWDVQTSLYIVLRLSLSTFAMILDFIKKPF